MQERGNFNKRLLDLAEQKRSNGDFGAAVRLSRASLGDEEIQNDIHFRLGFTGILVDSEKSSARRSIWPSKRLGHIDEASKAATKCYTAKTLEELNVNERAEVARRVSSLVEAIDPVLPKDQSSILLRSAIEMIDGNQSRLERSIPLSGLMGMETNKLQYRLWGVTSGRGTLSNFYLVKQSPEIKNNPDRVASAAIWAETLGRQMGENILIMNAQQTFRELSIAHPEKEDKWAQMQKEGRVRVLKEYLVEKIVRLMPKIFVLEKREQVKEQIETVIKLIS